MTVAELKSLVTFWFKAKKLSGASKHTSTKATAMAYLAELHTSGALKELLSDSPPAIVDTATPMLALM